MGFVFQCHCENIHRQKRSHSLLKENDLVEGTEARQIKRVQKKKKSAYPIHFGPIRICLCPVELAPRDDPVIGWWPFSHTLIPHMKYEIKSVMDLMGAGRDG